MTIRLNKVTRDLNVGIATVVEFLQKKGYEIEANPNTKITEEQYAVLVKEFSTDKNLKKESEKFIQERQNKERNKPTVSIEEEPKKEEVVKIALSEESRPKFKQVGKIDLDNLNKRPAPKAEEPVKEPEITEAKEPVVEAQKPVEEPQPVKVETPVVEEIKQEVPMEKETSEIKAPLSQEEEGVFKIRQTEFKSSINVLG